MAPTLASVASTATQVAAAAATSAIVPLLKRQSDGSDAAPADECAADNSDSHWGLRIGGIFVILATSLIGTFAPIILRSSRVIPRAFFE